MKELYELLKAASIEVSDDLKGKIDGLGLITQAQMDAAIQGRLARAEKQHESELAELRGKMEKLVDPGQIEEVKNQFTAQLDESKKRSVAEKKAYELKLAAARAGVQDLDYLEFVAGKQALYDRIEVADDGKLTVKTTDGKPLEKGMAGLLEELKATKPDMFKPAGSPGSGANPGAGNDPTPNPWASGTLNLTKQAEILRTNPDLAAKYKAEAGK